MELDELYQEVILDHAKRPRNRREMPQCTAMAHGDNPSCGDEVTVYVRLGDDGRVAEASFIGNGCAISQAAASILITQVRGRSPAEVGGLVKIYHDSLATDAVDAEDDRLGNLAALGGVRKFPQRVKCATLASHALINALAAVPGKT
jgi:nitrogen fixation NifU-like protein